MEQPIFYVPVVQNEIARIESLIGTDDGRNVEYDLELLKNALITINGLWEGTISQATIDANMWEECHHSLERIFQALHLEIDSDASEFDYYQWVIVKC